MADPNATAAIANSFDVTDRRPARDREDFHVRAYGADGRLSLHTWNTGEHSMQMEVSALLSRGFHPRGQTAEAAAATVRGWATKRSAS